MARRAAGSVRLLDVATAAGVSLRTASRVLNDDPRVASVTRQRVQAAMLELRFEPDAMARSLRAAGVGADGAARIAAGEVAEETDLTLRSPVELAKNNPALLAKIVGLLREALTPAEQQEAMTPAAAGRRKKGFLERATQYVASEEELFHLLEVIRPQFALARVTFTGDLEKVYRQKDQDFIDLLNRIRNNSVEDNDIARLNQRLDPDHTPDPATFYGGDARGYTDYPALEDKLVAA